MKKLFFIIFFLCSVSSLLARHVAGGELFYEYLGPGNGANTSNYRITLRLFRDCNSTGPQLQAEQVSVGVYENYNRVAVVNLPLTGGVTSITLNTATFPCLVGSVNVCYEVALYINTIELPINSAGYILARLGCCRIDAITNTTGGNSIGSTYITKIPGTIALPIGFNNSPKFNVKDTALVCAGKNFSLDFGATDVDGDVLIYSFCDAYTAGSGTNNSPPPGFLSLIPVPYVSPFSGTDPLAGPSINSNTGVISGIAPGIGQYVVSVCITEVRNGIPISEHRKDFILKVQNCDFVEANLPDKIIQCDSFSVLFQNQSTSSSIQSYLWNFGEPTSSSNISSLPTPVHVYADTGRYKASLTVTGPNGCVGTDSTIVIVYPGFYPGFTITGSCFQNPFHFNDTTKTIYGVVNEWYWDFGDLLTLADTSRIKNPSYTYPNSGIRNIKLFVANNKGCEKTIEKPLVVSDKPSLVLPFKDTLICSIDTLPLIAIGNGIFTWQPNINIINPNTSNPLVFPHDTTTYYVTLNENGCIAKDSIKVNVLNFIKVDAGVDSTVCKTDTFRLNPISHALGYLWTASTGENIAAVKYPVVQPLTNTMYYVKANLGKCEDKDSLLIKVAPYPASNAGADSSICFGGKVFLHGNIIGSSFIWAPANALINANTLHPIAAPSKDTYYVLTVIDTLGCPKPFSDSIFIKVIRPVTVYAGKDTMIVKNQPLQLYANSNFDNGVTYLWSPSTGLNDTHISNPISVINLAIDSIKYKVRVTIPEGCFGEDEIVVRIFNTNPDIFIPTAFTPNKDGKNDVFKPICVGIVRLDYFKIYNRWGQLIFETNEFEIGWDGKLNGTEQSSGTYVFMAQGIDYTGKVVYKKGTVVLIR
jgi:gliding motility-associated-like protein